MFVVPEDATPERADKQLASHFPEVSRGAVRKAIENGKIARQNGLTLLPKQKLFPGDVLLVDLSQEPVPTLRPVDIPLPILHEDQYLVVVNKPVGMVVHPGGGTGEDTLVHALLHHCGGRLSSIGAPERPGIVHRLDKDTSGVMVVAKEDSAHLSLVSQFSERKTLKEYVALVVGRPREKSGVIALPIGRHPTVRVKMSVSERGKEARTDWEIVKPIGDAFTLLRCIIHTGRTHQIRVHLSHMGHPVAGDETYGYKTGRLEVPPVPRILLHAKKLGFSHPADGKQLTIQAPLPDDFANYLDAFPE
ncbi:MAG: RluA family pseudouridine synthase [Opitutales bacterium]